MEKLMEPISSFKLPKVLHIENVYVRIAILIGILSFAVYYATTNMEQPFYPGIEIVSTDGSQDITYSKAKKAFKSNARELLWGGLKTCKGAFQVITTSGPEIILPQRYVNEMKNDDRFSLNGFTERVRTPSLTSEQMLIDGRTSSFGTQALKEDEHRL